MGILDESEKLQRATAQINDAIAEFDRTGMIVIRQLDVEHLTHWKEMAHERKKHGNVLSSAQLRRVLKVAALEAKRPLIIIEDDWKGPSIKTLTIKRSKKTERIIAPLMLLPERDARWKTRGDESTIYTREKTNFRATFSGKEGMKIFNSWFNGVLSDPECRAILKLPPLEAMLEEPTKVAA